MQRSTAVNAQDLCGFLELLLIGLVIIHIFVVVVIFILVAAAGRSVSLPLLGLAVASSSAGTFLAGSTSTFLGLLLVASLVLSFLQLNELLNLLATLEIVALGAVDLAILLAGASCLSAAATGWASLSEPPALASLAPPPLPVCSTASTSLPFFLLLFRRRPFLVGAASSLSDPPAPVLSPGSLLPLQRVHTCRPGRKAH